MWRQIAPCWRTWCNSPASRVPKHVSRAEAVADKVGDLPDDFHGARRWGLVLDLTGFTPAEEADLTQQLVVAVRARGVTVASALADTPDAARALARFTGNGVRALPLAALGLGEDRQMALRRAGLRRIGELADQPRGALAARFGLDLVRRLGRLLGDEELDFALPPSFFGTERRSLSRLPR